MNTIKKSRRNTLILLNMYMGWEQRLKIPIKEQYIIKKTRWNLRNDFIVLRGIKSVVEMVDGFLNSLLLGFIVIP